jgi:nitroimidazol reductase NimA-like FMN-containing flavoprotein (pyridoxamine 5'-phosphate oxidase superfamily)
MKATIGLEAIGYRQRAYGGSIKGLQRRAAVCELSLADDGQTLLRYPLSYRVDWEKANSVGSRGVYYWYILESEKCYEVWAPESWRSTDHYFCVVGIGGRIERVDEDEVKRWLREV